MFLKKVFSLFCRIIKRIYNVTMIRIFIIFFSLIKVINTAGRQFKVTIHTNKFIVKNLGDLLYFKHDFNNNSKGLTKVDTKHLIIVQ